MKSAQHYFPDVDVICDVGGQGIKVLFMENQTIKNFRLSNSCSADNGMLLQAMADQFGIPVTKYSEVAFNASLSPTFSYGCAVFLDSDGVQSLITELHPDAIFLPIEASGDGAVNVCSRVQMQLFKAKQSAKQEVDNVLEKLGVSFEEYRSPHKGACTSLDLACDVLSLN